MASKTCSFCNKNQKSSPREFSQAAWSILLAWDEVDEKDSQKPMCEPCYWDIREVLIDRSKEIDILVGKVFNKNNTKKVAV